MGGQRKRWGNTLKNYWKTSDINQSTWQDRHLAVVPGETLTAIFTDDEDDYNVRCVKWNPLIEEIVHVKVIYSCEEKCDKYQ
ncbi:hypothetical protein SK128_003683 [Halocaridina rubra]|uniref:Uncharacterized protein n=1 Tax=Halocaridina rubra TaxID=373956 RepID=A0AAN8XE99_HALRR